MSMNFIFSLKVSAFSVNVYKIFAELKVKKALSYVYF